LVTVGASLTAADEAFMKLLQGGEDSGVCGAGQAFQSSKGSWKRGVYTPSDSELAPHERTKPWWAAWGGEKAARAVRIHEGSSKEGKARKVEKALRKDVPNFKKYRSKCESFVNDHEEALVESVMEWVREECKPSECVGFVTPDYEALRAALCEQTACRKSKKKTSKAADNQKGGEF
jgi:hypothetical protein